MTATLVRCGAASLSNSSHLPAIEGSVVLNPVVLPSGRAMFRTKPVTTGSPPAVKTIGMVCVCCCTALVAAAGLVTITSGARPTSSAAYARMRSRSPAPKRKSIRRLRPSIQPSFASASRNAARWLGRRIVLGPRRSASRSAASPPCCALAASGHAAAAPPRRVMNSRRCMARPHSITSSASASSVGGTSRPSVLRRLQIDDELELRRPHDRQVGRLLALEDAAGVDAGLTITVREVGSVADQPAGFRDLAASE